MKEEKVNKQLARETACWISKEENKNLAEMLFKWFTTEYTPRIVVKALTIDFLIFIKREGYKLVENKKEK